MGRCVGEGEGEGEVGVCELREGWEGVCGCGWVCRKHIGV